MGTSGIKHNTNHLSSLECHVTDPFSQEQDSQGFLYLQLAHVVGILVEVLSLM